MFTDIKYNIFLKYVMLMLKRKTLQCVTCLLRKWSLFCIQFGKMVFHFYISHFHSLGLRKHDFLPSITNSNENTMETNDKISNLHILLSFLKFLKFLSAKLKIFVVVVFKTSNVLLQFAMMEKKIIQLFANRKNFLKEYAKMAISIKYIC